MAKETVKVDILIIGAGIVGLMTAYKMLRQPKLSGKTIVILDKAAYIGDHSSGRNSGVLHAGIYYTNNSLKHRYCLDGNRQWRTISKELNVPLLETGKYIFPSQQSELEQLDQIFENAILNEVPGMSIIPSSGVDTLQNFTNNAGKAILSKGSGIIDISSALNSLRLYLEQEGVIVSLNTTALDIDHRNGFFVETTSEIIESEVLINCAGLGAVAIRNKLSLSGIEDKFVKGNYLKYSKKLPISKLLYPVPPKDLSGLGVHLTLSLDGQILFGPDTEEVDEVDYTISDLTRLKMLDSIDQLFKGVDPSNLSVDYCGIRPKIKLNGTLFTDFYIRKQDQIPGYIEALGIESPGLTAAPAIADEIISLMTL